MEKCEWRSIKQCNVSSFLRGRVENRKGERSLRYSTTRRRYFAISSYKANRLACYYYCYSKNTTSYFLRKSKENLFNGKLRLVKNWRT